MVRSTSIMAAILSPVSQAIGIILFMAAILSAVNQGTGSTLFRYFNPPGHLWNSSRASFTKEELLSYQGRRQSWAILLFLFAFSMSFMPFVLRIWDGRRNKTEHEVTLQAETKEDTKAKTKTTKLTTSIKSTKVTKAESETSEAKEARSTKIEPSEKLTQGDQCDNFSTLFNMHVEIAKTKSALENEQERVNRMELVMESLQSQIDALQAKSTVKGGGAKNRAQAIEEDRQRQTDILTTRIMTQEAKMEEVLGRLEENDRSHDAIDVCIENFTNEAVKTKEELKRFDCLDNKINEVEDLLVDEISNLEEAAKDNLEEFRADILSLENYLAGGFQNLEDKKHSRESEIRKDIKNGVKEELRREQEKRELDEFWEERLKNVGSNMEEVAINEEVQDEMKEEVTNTVPTVERSSQTEAETTETGINQEIVGTKGGDKKRETDPLAEIETKETKSKQQVVETKDDADKNPETDPLTKIETMIRERERHPNRSIDLAMHFYLIRERYKILEDLEREKNGAIEDLEQGKDGVMEDIMDTLKDTVEGEEKGGSSDEDWEQV
ncbi:hypothetical protein BofuT4_P118160.1 [Botrytis cinerea T4]|uniref:Uncharacterized protein n=1 Tax=Botryotinia fuckeliana (strain T4) TaxID=999810 RepID=G2Y0V1_BOTF4|nr:hypothetical protein BofuT4_P118160.1 [Botrytis cinerea T4]